MAHSPGSYGPRGEFIDHATAVQLNAKLKPWTYLVAAHTEKMHLLFFSTKACECVFKEDEKAET